MWSTTAFNIVTSDFRKVISFCLVIAAVCILVLSLAGCSRDKVGPSPTELGFGDIIEESKAELTAAAGQFVSLSGGTKLEIPAGSLAGETELVLIRSRVPDGLEEYGLITDVYYAASGERTFATGDYTLAIPYDASLLPEDVSEEFLQAFAVLDGPFLFPVPCDVDTDRQVVIISSPNITVRDPSSRLLAQPLYVSLAVERVTTVSPPQTERPGIASNWGYTIGYKGGPGYGARPPWVEGDARLSCSKGAAGEVHEEEGHDFRIVLEVPTKCETVSEISSLLMEAVTSIRETYNLPAEFPGQNRMNVIIGNFDFNGAYDDQGSIGYVMIDQDWYVNEETVEADRKWMAFHELFHYAQWAHVDWEMWHAFAGWNQAKWWREATANWVGFQGTGESYDTLVRIMFSTFPELLSIPIRESGNYDLKTLGQGEGKYYYGYAVLIQHVEGMYPGYLKEAVDGYDMSGDALYSTLVQQGRLATTYPDFVRSLMEIAIPDPGFWTTTDVIETKASTTIHTHWFKPSGTGEFSPESFKDDEERAGPHRLFADSLGPLTTQFFRMQFQGVAKEPRCVKVQLDQGGRPSDQAWLVPVTGTKAGTPVRLSASGTKMGGMGNDYDELWIAVFNPDPTTTKPFELNVEYLDGASCEGGLWVLDRTVVTPASGFLEWGDSSSATLTDSRITLTWSDDWWTPQYVNKEYAVTFSFTVDALPRSLAPGDVLTMAVQGKGSLTGEKPSRTKPYASVDIFPVTDGKDSWEAMFQWIEGDEGANYSTFIVAVEDSTPATKDHVVKLMAPDIFDGEIAIVLELNSYIEPNIKWIYKAQKE